MKKGLLVVTAGMMALLLSSCFTLQSFSLRAGALVRGQATTAVFVVRPSSSVASSFSKLYQFVLVGVSNTADVTIGKATWNANRNLKFAARQNMPVSSTLSTSIGTDCDSGGFTYSGISGITWKGFITLNPVNDKHLVSQTVAIAVGLKATAAAGHHDTVTVIGLTGTWVDDGDGILNAPDTFSCTGNATASLFIK